MEKLKKAEYISHIISERVFDGDHQRSDRIWAVRAAGKYRGRSGAGSTSLYDDYYDYDAEQYLLKGRRNGKVYKLGDTVRIFVDNVDTDRGEIDFLLADFSPYQGQD